MSGTFSGGVHPDDAKDISKNCALEPMPLPAVVVLPVSQHLGAPAKVIVEKGRAVKKGDVVAEPGGFVSIPFHASISGTIKAIEQRYTPLGKKVLSVIIESDGEDRWSDGLNMHRDFASISRDEKRSIVRDAGIVGMGGAAFPTHVKLSPPENKPIDTVILNGVECEPYVTCDYRLILERSRDIVEGFKIIMEILNCSKGVIGIEGNKPDAIKIMREAVVDVRGITVEELKVKYPQGGEKQLIYAVTGRRVPAGGLPMDVGCVVQNVGTAAAIYEAVMLNKPLIERAVTVTGHGVVSPRNVIARIGDSFANLIAYAGGYTEKADKLIMGGPMMGLAQFTDDVPVTKGTSNLLVMEEHETRADIQQPCISCARCVDVCPMNLMPTTISLYVEHEHWDEVKEYGALDCNECGSCSYICPVKRKLVEYIRFGKATLTALRAKELAAKKAAE